MSVVEPICQARNYFSGREMTESNSRSATTIVPAPIASAPRRASGLAPRSGRLASCDVTRDHLATEMNGAPGVRQGSCLASTRAAMKVVVEADSVILFETRLVQSRILHFKLAAT